MQAPELRPNRAQQPLPPGPDKRLCTHCNNVECERIGKNRSKPCSVCGGRGWVWVNDEKEQEEQKT